LNNPWTPKRTVFSVSCAGPLQGFKKIPFLNTIKRILMFVAAIAVRAHLMKNGPFISTVAPGFVASVSRLFCVNFKPGSRMFGTGVHEKSAVRLRDF
jgi:hypothetical protein